MKKIVSLVVCSLLLGSLVCFTGCGSGIDVSEVAYAQGGANNVKWEYKVVIVNIKEREAESTLNKQGSEGWELVSYDWQSDTTIFKRRK
jgi:hypothetical protein